MLEAEITVGKTYRGAFGSDRHVEHIYDQRKPARVWWKNEFNGTGVQDLRSFAEWANSETPNVKVTGAPATVIKGEKNVKKLTRYAGLIAGASLLTAGLGGCANEDPQKPDQCMRREIFMQCMAALPAGPKATMYNDWAEVVGECDNAAHYQSLRRKSQIKPECQP